MAGVHPTRRKERTAVNLPRSRVFCHREVFYGGQCPPGPPTAGGSTRSAGLIRGWCRQQATGGNPLGTLAQGGKPAMQPADPRRPQCDQNAVGRCLRWRSAGVCGHRRTVPNTVNPCACFAPSPIRTARAQRRAGNPSGHQWVDPRCVARAQLGPAPNIDAASTRARNPRLTSCVTPR